MIKVQTRPKVSTRSKARYLSSDFSLEAEVYYPAGSDSLSESIDRKLGISSDDGPFLVIYGGELTIRFDGREKLLVGIDAYTNSNKWVQKELRPPSGTESSLQLNPNGDLETDRASIQGEPKYFYNPSRKLLEIALADRHGEILYNVTDTLVVGVSGNLVSSIFISDLSVQ